MLRGGYGLTRLLDRIDFAALAKALGKRWMGQRFHGVPARGARDGGHGDVRGADGELRFRRGDAVGVHARAVLRRARQRRVGSRVRARRPPRTRARRHAVGRQPRAWSRISRARRTCPTSRAASSSSRTSASTRIASSGCSTSCSRRHSGAAARGAARRLHRVRAERERRRLRPRGGDCAHPRTRGVPVYTGLPFGHVPDKLTLPVGGRCELDGARRPRDAALVRLRAV